MTASPTASSAPNPSWRQISRSLYATRAERGKYKEIVPTPRVQSGQKIM